MPGLLAPGCALTMAGVLLCAACESPTATALQKPPRPAAALNLVAPPQDLGSLTAYASIGQGINLNGSAVGWSRVVPGQFSLRATLWSNGQITDLQGLGGTVSAAVSVNNKLHVVGWANDVNGNWRGFFWANGVASDMGTGGGVWVTVSPHSINSSDVVVGHGSVAGETGKRAFQWVNGTFTELALPPGATDAFAYGINDRNQIVGSVGSAAALWENGVPRLLPSPSGMTSCIGSAVNANEDVAGICSNGTTSLPVVWRSGTPVLLDPLGATWAGAAGINRFGQVVGGGVLADGTDIGLAWMPDGTAVQLSTLGGTGASAYAINDRGEIIGASADATGPWHAVTWQISPLALH